MNDFADKVALITGGGTGIGRATAELLAESGAKVVVTGRRPAPLEELSKRFPNQIAYKSGDVTNPEDVQRVVDFTLNKFKRIDILINNAGMIAGGPLRETDPKDITRQMDTNVTSMFLMIRAALPALTEASGAIVNTSSTIAQAVFPGMAIYAASKAAVETLTRNLAAEFGPEGIRVNAVAPGYTVTPMSAPFAGDMEQGVVTQTPLGRPGQPADIAKAIRFLASEDASWITGQILQSSGGLHL